MARRRRAIEDELTQEVTLGGATQDAAMEPDEFARFQDLTRKLMGVPKAELDEKRRAEKD